MRILILLGIPACLLLWAIRAIRVGRISQPWQHRPKVYYRHQHPREFWALVLILMALSITLMAVVLLFASG